MHSLWRPRKMLIGSLHLRSAIFQGISQGSSHAATNGALSPWGPQSDHQRSQPYALKCQLTSKGTKFSPTIKNRILFKIGAYMTAKQIYWATVDFQGDSCPFSFHLMKSALLPALGLLSI